MTKTFLFIMPGPVPIANRRVAHHLSEAFPEFKCKLLDCAKELRAKPMTMAYLCGRAVLANGPGVLGSRRKLREALWRSAATETWIKAWVAKGVASGNVAFSFQMQSLFDASVPGCPHFVFTDHTYLENEKYPLHERGPDQPQHVKDREAGLYAHATGLFVRSQNIRRSLIEQYHCDSEKIEVVYAGSNLQEGPSENVTNDERDPFTILFVGVDWERKGGPELLTAFRQLRNTHPRARLVIAGTSPEIPKDLDGVEVIGRVSIDRLGQLYRRAGIFCLPTRREPFGIVFLEAMQHGLPVVGTDIGAQVDFIRDDETGYRVPVLNPEAIATALRKLCDNPDAAKAMGQRGEELVRERYNWKSVIAKMASTIRRKAELQ